MIFCNTGIALLAYMDGISRSPTLGGVVLAAAASAGSAVYKAIDELLSQKNISIRTIMAACIGTGIVQTNIRRSVVRPGFVLLHSGRSVKCHLPLADHPAASLYRSRSHCVESCALDASRSRWIAYPGYNDISCLRKTDRTPNVNIHYSINIFLVVCQ